MHAQDLQPDEEEDRVPHIPVRTPRPAGEKAGKFDGILRMKSSPFEFKSLICSKLKPNCNVGFFLLFRCRFRFSA